MSSILVRRATHKDLSAIARLGALLLREHYAFDRERFMQPAPDADERYGRFLVAHLPDPDALVLVAERDDQVVGYLYAAIEPRNLKELREEAGFVHDVLVDQQNRRSGIAEALLQAALRWMRERGVPRVMLWTSPANAPALRLFTRLGFRSTMIEMTKELRTEPVS